MQLTAKEFLEDIELYNPDIESALIEFGRICARQALISAEDAVEWDYSGLYVIQKQIRESFNLYDIK